MKKMLTLLIVLILVCSANVWAAISFVSQESYVASIYQIYAGGGVQVSYGYQNIPASGFGPFDATATQISSYDNVTGAISGISAVFSPLAIAGTGSAEAVSTASEFSTSNSETCVKVRFTCDEAVDYEILGVLNSTEAANSQFKIYCSQNYQDVLSIESAWGEIRSVSLNETGTLAAGDYTLYVYANGWSGGAPFTNNTASFDFALNFIPTPEPASLLVMGLGAVLIRRKR